MDGKGAAILNFSNEFGENGVSRAMINDGENFRENNIPNKVTPYTNVSPSNSMGPVDRANQDDSIVQMADRSNDGYIKAKGVGLGGSL